MMNNNERNIYDCVIIVYYDHTDIYSVRNTQDLTNWHIIWNGKDLATAKAVKKAYCDGYVDGKNKGE